MITRKELDDAFNKMSTTMTAHRVIEVDITASIPRANKIKAYIRTQYAKDGMNIVFKDQLMKSVFDQIEWKEVD